MGLHVIPYPQQVELGGDDFVLQNNLTLVLDKNATAVDRKTAEKLITELKEKWGIAASISDDKGAAMIMLTRKGISKKIVEQGYVITTDKSILTITANDEDGLFYGVQTLFQIIKRGRDKIFVPGIIDISCFYPLLSC